MKIRMLGLLAASVFAASTLSPAIATAQTPVRFSVAGGFGPPIGTLGDQTSLGFNLNLRGETASTSEWGLRGDLAWDRFGGRRGIDAYSYLGLAGNIMHRESGRIYEFGGLGVYDQRVSFAPNGGVGSADDMNLGMQFGLGYNFPSSNRTQTFMEFGLTNVFTTGANSTWFPVRFGIRF